MMEHIQFSFSCKVIRKTIDGFTAILPDEYLIKYRDTKYHYFFDIGDTLSITIENVTEIRNDEVKEDYAIIYVILHSFMSNGFLFRDIGDKRGFFWASRGMITHKVFEKNDYWEEDNLLKIIIKK